MKCLFAEVGQGLLDGDAQFPDASAQLLGFPFQAVATHGDFRAEQPLRNQLDRSYEARTDFSLRDLEGGGSEAGPDRAPDTDVRAYLLTQLERP